MSASQPSYSESTASPDDSRLSPATRRMLKAAAIILSLIALLFLTSSLWVNWWWFSSMGYRDVLSQRYQGKLIFFLIGAAIAFLFLATNIVIALRRTKRNAPAGRVASVADGALRGLLAIALLIVCVLFGLNAASHWDDWQLFWLGDEFGIVDPVFDKDVGFYVFKLPVLDRLVNYALLLTILAPIAIFVVYMARWGLQVRDIRQLPEQLRSHLFTLGGLFMLALAARFVINNYQLVYSDRGAAFGASYTDVNVQRYANWALVIGALIVAALLILNGFINRYRLLFGVLAVWGAVVVVLGWLLPSIVQRTIVEPNELNRERPYIENNIAMTRLAFAVDGVAPTDITGTDELTAAALAEHVQTMENIRLWDYRVAASTFQQLQSFVPFYVFPDLDVDRYEPDGELQQVLLAARELDQTGLPSTAQTWTNEHLVYTHGYGVVVSGVSDVSPQGLPLFVVERIPPNGEGVFTIDRPEIYFGEATHNWVIVNTDQPEFDGLVDTASGESPGFSYDGAGRGAVQLDNYLKKLLLAVDLGDRNLLFSGALNDDSRVMLRREITDRIEQVAPFLSLDGDPYLVIVEGKLYWIADAFTTSDKYPHASSVFGVNYVRNSVKVVVDAYHGEVTFYRTNVPDPIADAYNDLYDDFMRPIDEVPAGIAAHFRYPETLFEVQSEILLSYHVTDPDAFYNGEDRWAIPTERLGETEQQMEPFFVTLAMPGEVDPDFTLIRPFIPGGRSQRQNMTAWMGGRSDLAGVNVLSLFRFPRQTTVFGPTQVAARIDQEPEISAQISLWNQSGSRVIRGNLLVIPVENSVLYVQPLYLQAASSQGALPELKRVIVASQDRVVMRDSLLEALAAVTTPGADPLEDLEDAEDDATPAEPTAGAGSGTIEELSAQALAAFQRGEAALQDGDWVAYAESQVELEQLLLQIEALQGGTEVAPAATPEP